jgi:hypothetical protein
MGSAAKTCSASINAWRVSFVFERDSRKIRLHEKTHAARNADKSLPQLDDFNVNRPAPAMPAFLTRDYNLVVNHVLGRGGELLVAFNDFLHCVQEVLLSNCLPPCPDREHPGLGAHGANVRAC